MALTLNHIEHRPEGAETAPPLLIAHGLFGSARNFNTLGKRLAVGRRVVLVDMRNHGASPWSDEMDYPAMAADLAGMIECLFDGPAVVLGHSMGGKAAMGLALGRPELVAGLIVADIAPVGYTHSHLGYVRAMRALDLAHVKRRSDADPLLREGVPEPSLRSFLLQNLIIEEGAPRWRLNLAVLARAMPALIGWPDDWPQDHHDGPAFFLRGTLSDHVPDSAFPAIRARFPRAEIDGIEAQHWLHAEKPAEFATKVEGWLAGP